MLNRCNQALALRLDGLSASDIAQRIGVPLSTVGDWIRSVELTPEQKAAIAQRRTDAATAVTRKTAAQEAARQLRHEGMSVRKIAITLGVSPSSASLWVRDIVLSDAQRATLKEGQHNFRPGPHKGSQANMLKHREIRRGYQEEGRAKARERDPLHIAGCMLFWAEGKKNKNILSLINSDPDMLVFFERFLRESLGARKEDMALHIHCYTNNGVSLEEIEQYWLDFLSLPRSCLRKSTVNVQPSSSKQKGRKLIYGVCDLSVYQTRLVQHVYGAIQEYAGIDKPEWLQ
jgi:transposase